MHKATQAGRSLEEQLNIIEQLCLKYNINNLSGNDRWNSLLSQQLLSFKGSMHQLATRLSCPDSLCVYLSRRPHRTQERQLDRLIPITMRLAAESNHRGLSQINPVNCALGEEIHHTDLIICSISCARMIEEAQEWEPLGRTCRQILINGARRSLQYAQGKVDQREMEETVMADLREGSQACIEIAMEISERFNRKFMATYAEEISTIHQLSIKQIIESH